MSAFDHLSPDQFGEPFRDPDEPFTYAPDRRRPRGVQVDSLQPFDPYEDSEVGPMTGRAN